MQCYLDSISNQPAILYTWPSKTHEKTGAAKVLGFLLLLNINQSSSGAI